MEAIYKREMQSYFKSPVAYCIIGFFAALTGLYFWNVNVYNQSISFTNTLSAMTMYLIFFIPILTMKLFADDKKSGTEVLLRTSPVKTASIVLGKYLASVSVFAIMVAETLICPIIMLFFVNDGGVFPFAMTVGGYIAFFLLGATYCAIGTFASSISDSQPIAALIGMVILIILTFLETVGSATGGKFGKILTWLSLSSRYSDFAAGSFNVASAFYFVSFAAIMLFVTTMNIERKRWN